VNNQRDAVLSSPFIVLQNHSTCFRCPLHPSDIHDLYQWLWLQFYVLLMMGAKDTQNM